MISGCEANFQGTNNSSQGDNDYFEEPLSSHSKKYSAALETSNDFVQSLSEGRLTDARDLLDPRLQAIVTEDDFRSMYAQVLRNFGPFVEYKPMQWGFSKSARLENVVVSIKIVVHKNTETFYILNFEDNGIYDRIIAFRIVPRSDGERVFQAAAHAYGLEQQ
jgi:hypothetical protein